jgi:prepilin-type N-terminal cleavage/methylation domain-containing protein
MNSAPSEPGVSSVPSPRRKGMRRGFSLVEMLVALAISALLLTAALVALDAMFKRYTEISEASSTHMIARTSMHRMMALIRTGREFSPYPVDPTDSAQNPLTSSNIEFLSQGDFGGFHEITRIERRTGGTFTLQGEQITLRGPNTLWLRVIRRQGTTTLSDDFYPLLEGVVDARFILEYEPGPRLVLATVDLTVLPMGNNVQTGNGDAWSNTATVNGVTVDNRSIASDGASEVVRLISSTAPRGLN